MSIFLFPVNGIFPQSFEDFVKMPLIGTTIDREEMVIYLRMVIKTPNNQKFSDGLKKWADSLNTSLDTMYKIYQLQTRHKTTLIENKHMFPTDQIINYTDECNDNWSRIGDQIRSLLNNIGTSDYGDILPWKYQQSDLGNTFFHNLISDNDLQLERLELDKCTSKIEKYLFRYGDIEQVIKEESKDPRFVIN